MTGASVRGPDLKYLHKYNVDSNVESKASKFADST